MGWTISENGKRNVKSESEQGSIIRDRKDRRVGGVREPDTHKIHQSSTSSR